MPLGVRPMLIGLPGVPVAAMQGRFALLVALVMAGGSAAALIIGVQQVRAGELSLGSLLLVMAYLKDIMSRRPTIREALTEYNGGPSGRHPHYYRMVMGAYVEVLEHSELRCRFRETPKPAPLTALLLRA